jgi:hypothetical protein
MKDRNLVIRLNVRFGSAADDQIVQSLGLVERAASGHKRHVATADELCILDMILTLPFTP